MLIIVQHLSPSIAGQRVILTVSPDGIQIAPPYL